RFRGRLPIAAVFDTAFHVDMPASARTYAIPHELTQRHGIRRFGFHGIAITSVLAEYAHRTGAHAADQRLVVLHLGSGASVTAIRGARGIDTSMGFSPLEGLVMATRSGDLDPSLIPYLARAEHTTADEVVRCLNQRSGLLGISGRSGDMREIEQLRNGGDPRASLAFDLFAYRAKKHLAGMIAALGGVDAVLFSGGIGENSAAARAAVCCGMEWCGVAIDASLNAQPARSGGRISPAEARVGIHVVPADEERIIARETCSLVTSSTA
ncbi:MAG: acetate kinase, partial [Dehalococcoidia bacterium]